MKILTTSFLTCAVKSCKSSPASFPLHYRDAELEVIEMAYSPEFLQGILPRLDWDAVKVTAGEVSTTSLKETRLSRWRTSRRFSERVSRIISEDCWFMKH